MARQRTFLTAEWKNLLMLNYAVDPALLQPLVPAGTELDQFEGKTYVSLIGFEFNKTRVFGRAIPFHQSFEEVNLRFYVRRSGRRGVVFIGELVPKFAVTAIAKFVYGERYSCVTMAHRIDKSNGITTAAFSWGSSSDRCTISAETLGDGYLPQEGSLGQFITEHYWGYAAQGTGGTLEYQVEHPQWNVSDANRACFSGNAEKYFGAEFARVLGKAPDSAFLTEGSGVTVFKGVPIR
ncbi:MAG TPA: DUF2071 domain-containing protein [Terracidiphilus sp.]|nr:DUF2071 domain-containing protein [Terracidiphilus sp.]